MNALNISWCTNLSMNEYILMCCTAFKKKGLRSSEIIYFLLIFIPSFLPFSFVPRTNLAELVEDKAKFILQLHFFHLLLEIADIESVVGRCIIGRKR